MVKIGIIQMGVDNDKFENINAANEHVKECAQQGADIVVLPEIFNGPYSTSKFKDFAEEKGRYTYTALSNMAKHNNIYLVGGSIPEIEGDKIYNTSFIFDNEGKEIGRHRKMHLFDINVIGGQSFKESDALTAGDSVCVFDTPFCKIGVCICFDMRFPELSRLMVLQGAKIIIVPAAFNMTTGPAHWELMFRQRAVDNQCFTVGVAPARNTEASYVSFANSIVVHPWGNVLFQAGSEECVKVIDLDLNEVDSIRNQLPLLSARRTDIYTLSLNETCSQCCSSKYNITKASENDAFKIYYVLNKARDKLQHKGINQWSEGWEIDDIINQCKESKYYVMKDKNRIIGCYLLDNDYDAQWFKDLGKDSVYLSSICLLPEYQSKGIGKELIESAVINSQKNTLYLDCWSGNNKLKDFYKDNGFEYVKDYPENDYTISIFKKSK